MRCFLLSFLFLFSGCMVQSKDIDKEDQEIPSSNLAGNYYNNSSNGSICPPPYKIIVIVGGKPTEQTVVNPCYLSNTNEVFSDKDWGTSEDHSFWVPESLPKINNQPPGDPIP